MLEYARGLTPRQLEAVASLEAAVVAADGGRLKLEWGVLRSRPPHEVRDLLWWEGDRLVGFLGAYGFGWGTRELAGMVAPESRRQGIGSALLRAALASARRSDREPGAPERLLLVVPRNRAGGHEFALAHGAVLEHSEHSMLLSEAPIDRPADPVVSLRQAVAADRPVLSTLYEEGFGNPLTDGSPLKLRSDRTQTLVVLHGGAPVGTVRLTLDDDRGRIHGLVVGSRWRGRGIGRQVLLGACRLLWDRGARQVGLEVEVANERALGLYTSAGFRLELTEDYYELPGPGPLTAVDSRASGFDGADDPPRSG